MRRVKETTNEKRKVSKDRQKGAKKEGQKQHKTMILYFA